MVQKNGTKKNGTKNGTQYLPTKLNYLKDFAIQ